MPPSPRTPRAATIKKVSQLVDWPRKVPSGTPTTLATSGSNPMITNSVVPIPKAPDAEGQERERHGARTFLADRECGLRASTRRRDHHPGRERHRRRTRPIHSGPGFTARGNSWVCRCVSWSAPGVASPFPRSVAVYGPSSAVHTHRCGAGTAGGGVLIQHGGQLGRVGHRAVVELAA